MTGKKKDTLDEVNEFIKESRKLLLDAASMLDAVTASLTDEQIDKVHSASKEFTERFMELKERGEALTQTLSNKILDELSTKVKH